MFRRALVVLAATVGMIFAAAPAQADKPTKIPAPVTPTEITVTGTDKGGIGCPFDVKITPLENKEKTTIFSDGRQLVTGTFKVRLTRLDTGKSVDVNASGPGTFTPNEDGSFTGVFKGRSLIFPNGPEGPASHLFLVTSGRTIMIVNKDFTSFTLLNMIGGSVDLCKALS
jgi:hypothetical protein